MTWLIFWFGLSIGTALGIAWSVAMYFVLRAPPRTNLPRAEARLRRELLSAVVHRADTDAWVRTQVAWSMKGRR